MTNMYGDNFVFPESMLKIMPLVDKCCCKMEESRRRRIKMKKDTRWKYGI